MSWHLKSNSTLFLALFETVEVLVKQKAIKDGTLDLRWLQRHILSEQVASAWEI